jgi:hypothetical protein
VGGAGGDIQIQVHFFLKGRVDDFSVGPDGNVEVHEDQGVNMAIAGPTELAPVVEAGKEVFPAVRLAGLIYPDTDAIIDESFEEKEG